MLIPGKKLYVDKYNIFKITNRKQVEHEQKQKTKTYECLRTSEKAVSYYNRDCYIC